MRNKLLTLCAILVVVALSSFYQYKKESPYTSLYVAGVNTFIERQGLLMQRVENSELNASGLTTIKQHLYETRLALKTIDFWLRYLEPLAYKKLNAPLPVEWETEVFEKYEKPYKRVGAGLTLAALYLEEERIDKDSLTKLLKEALQMSTVYLNDSVTRMLHTFDHFYYCNRLFLLNLAAIYTTGFECPDATHIVPELRGMLQSVQTIYTQYNLSFPDTPIPVEYLALYENALRFVNAQPSEVTGFNHFEFLRSYVNPLFAMNQELLRKYAAQSTSYMDYTLNKNCNSIFSKQLYRGQATKGVYSRIYDATTLREIESLGRTLFHDPILSGNNQRSCASCHKTSQAFTDTLVVSAPTFDKSALLPRNTPSLLNADFNHLLMADGKHFSLHNQTADVLTNPAEMGSTENVLLQKVLSCKTYEKALKRLLKKTPEQAQVRMDHITSAIVYYYSRFSNYYAPFDYAMNNGATLSQSAIRGFNLFMGKAQCATCHFVPQFNGVKPPYIGSEFEVLGVPADTVYSALSTDKGRYTVHAAHETHRAFRTGTIRNARRTKPYMHNGVFATLQQVIEFYNNGGGAGHGLTVENQTLSSDSLHLTATEKIDLLAFIAALNEDIPADTVPVVLPLSKNKLLNKRAAGGNY